jgi:hypothetical protein
LSTGQEGCTPGFWKNHKGAWPAPYTTSSQFDDVFNVSAAFAGTLGGGKTLLNVLKQGGGCEKALGRHAVAALLNSLHVGVSFGKSSGQVISKVNAALATANCAVIEATKNELADLNEQACPLDGKVADP